jgi:hypothetical protein
MHTALGMLATYVMRLKDPAVAERLEKKSPAFLKGLRAFLDVDQNGRLDPDEIEQAANTIARLAPVAAEFVRLQSGVGSELEEPHELVARVGQMLRDPTCDRMKLAKRYPPFANLEPGKVSGIALLVDNDPSKVIDALLAYESGDFKTKTQRDDRVAYSRVSGD